MRGRTMKLDKKIKRPDKVEKTTVLVCPDCGNTNIVWEGGYITGQKYHCVDCHYRGSFILKREVVVREDETVEEL